MTTHSSPQNGTHAHDTLIFLSSSTPEKLRDYQMICEAKKLPIHFLGAHELLDAIHSSEENTKTYRGNALDKLKNLKLALQLLPNGEAIMQKKCEQYGFTYNPQNIYFATEDSGSHIPKDIWAKVDKTGIPQKALNSIDEKGGHGPGVELAPVLSSTLGAQKLIERIYDAAKQLGYEGKDHVRILEKAVLTLDPFMTGTQLPTLIEGKGINYLHAPDKKPHPGERVGTYHYYRPNAHPEKSCAELGEEFIVSHSARAHVVEKLAKETLKIPDYARKALPLRPAPIDDFSVGLLPLTKDAVPHAAIDALLRRSNGAGKHFKVRYPEHDDSPQNRTSRNFLSAVDDIVRHSDGFILLPDSERKDTPDSKFEKFYTLFSLMVAKQLVARDMQKPIVILNHDGSWNEAIANHMDLVNLGMTKDHSIIVHDTPAGLPHGVRVRSNSYFDEVRADSYDDALKAGLQVLNKRRERYQRRPYAPSVEYELGVKPDPKQFKVAIFCSAANENEHLNQQMERLSYGLSSEGYGIVYGAGDRYTMGAVLSGVAKNRSSLEMMSMPADELHKRAWIGGYSTEPILKSETDRGTPSPLLSYFKQTRNIYDRMADMLDTCNALVVAPGGAGTVQEWVGALMLKKTAPELFKNKPIVIFNPPLNNEKVKVWDSTLKALLGKDYDLLTKDKDKLTTAEAERREDRCRKLGVYVETDVPSVEMRIQGFARQYTTRIQPRSSTWTADRNVGNSQGYLGL